MKFLRSYILQLTTAFGRRKELEISETKDLNFLVSFINMTAKTHKPILF